MGIFRQFPYSNFHELNMDEILKILKTLSEEWDATKTEWSSYKDFIDNYFATLNLDEETEKALRKLLNDGSLNTVIDPVIITQVTEWLAEHITPTTPAIDSSLTISGAGADAKKVGDIFKNIMTKNRNLVKLADRTTSTTNVTLVQNKETGEVNITGSATSNISPQVYTDGGIQFSFLARAHETYTLSGCPEGGSPSTFDLDIRTSSGGTIAFADYGDGVTFSPNVDTTYFLHIRLVAGNGNGLRFKPQIEIGGEKTTFIPYAKESAYDDNAEKFIEIIDTVVNTPLSDGGVINQMLKVGESYIKHNSDLVYGQQTAIHWYENGQDMTEQKLFIDDEIPTEIDCSSLALLVTQGVPYENSRYKIGANYIGSAGYSYDIYNGIESDRSTHLGERTLTYHLAKWCDENNLGFECDGYAGNIKSGDILFFASDEADAGAWKNIVHCEILIDKFSNYPDNLDFPTLVTLNASANRDADGVVQCNNRVASFYNGSSPTHFKLVYCARLPKGVVENKNVVFFENPKRNVSTNMPLALNKYDVFTLEFDGTVNVANTHFTVYINDTPRVTLRNVHENNVGDKLHYKLVFASQWSSADYITIRNTSDNTAVIENIFLCKGINK